MIFTIKEIEEATKEFKLFLIENISLHEAIEHYSQKIIHLTVNSVIKNGYQRGNNLLEEAIAIKAQYDIVALEVANMLIKE